MGVRVSIDGFRIYVSLACFLAMLWFAVTSASAQGGGEGTPIPGEPTEIHVLAVLCTDESCDAWSEAIRGMWIEARDVHPDEVIDTCVTEASGRLTGCMLEVGDATFYLAWDETKVPDGYTYLGRPIERSDELGGLSITLGFYSDAEEDADDGDEVVKFLPKTGAAGPEDSGLNGAVLVAGILTGASMLTGLMMVTTHARMRS